MRVSKLLGGAAGPIGWSVPFLDTPLDALVDALRNVHSGHPLEVEGVGPYPACLERLPPFEAPWTRELVMACGSWTAYLNNFVDGGDPSAVGPAVARLLGVRCVVATHTPRYGPGHQATQLEVTGPGGVPPMMCERSVSASATDGRWEWHAFGTPFPFEDTGRYQARRVRDRFDRGLLVDYLGRLRIHAEDDAAYGDGVLLQQHVPWLRRTVWLEDARRGLT